MINARFPLLVLFASLLLGCGVGDAPKGLSPEETRATVESLPPRQQIDYINRSPLPAAEKAKRIAAIKAKAGLK